MSIASAPIGEAPIAASHNGQAIAKVPPKRRATAIADRALAPEPR